MPRASRKKSTQTDSRSSVVDRFGKWLAVHEPNPKFDMLTTLAEDFLRHIGWNPCDATVLAARYLEQHTEIAKPQKTDRTPPLFERSAS